MTQGSSPTNGIQWDVGAISNAEWTGVKIVDVLKRVDVQTSSIFYFEY